MFFYISQKNFLRLSLRDFNKILHSTFIYKDILIKISMNAKIMKMQIYFNLSMTEKVIEGHIRPPCSKYNIFKTFKSFDQCTTLIYMYFICIVHLNNQIVHIFSAWVFKILDLRQRENYMNM